MANRESAIMKYLIVNRQTTVCEIAEELCVSDRTIRSDLVKLTTEYPIEVVRGNGGGVRLPDGYGVNRNGFTLEDFKAIYELIPIVDEEQAKVSSKGIEQSFGRAYSMTLLGGWSFLRNHSNYCAI